MMTSGISNNTVLPAAASSGTRNRALWRAAEQFETIFVNQLLGEMESSRLGSDGLSGPGAAIYRGMLNERLAGKMATQDPFGIARLLVDQLADRGDKHVSPASTQTDRATKAVSETQDIANSGVRRFSRAVLPLLKKAARELQVAPRILLAQAALETGWGRHVPRTHSGASTHNVFGVKAGESWSGRSVRATTREYRAGTEKTELARFRAYPSIADAIHDFVKVARAIVPRFSGHETLTAREWGQLLMQGGYATDPGYAAKLQAVASGHLMDVAMDSAERPSSSVANVTYNDVSPR